jgi:ubiquinone/menaquinone biosynthesis C-methylase UbiE
MSDARRKYDEWHRTLASEEGEAAGLAPWHEAALPHLGALQGVRILEIGCGRGDFGKILSAAGARSVVLADFSPRAVAVARERVGTSSGCAFITADIERLPFPDGAFDLVCSFETIEHVPSPGAAVRELVRVTRVGGRLVITSPNYLGIAGLYRIYRRLIGRPYTEMGQPINQPLILPWRVRLLRALGCRLEFVDGFGHYLYLPGRIPRRIAVLDRLRRVTRWFGLQSITVATRT